jgi:hypothetical protein
VLRADYQVLCHVPGGIASPYEAFKVVAIVAVFFIPFGIPLYFGYCPRPPREHRAVRA